MMTPRPNMIRALAADLAAGRTTSVALTEAALEHAAAHRAAGGAAYVSIDEQAALAMARAADAAREAGNVPSLLAGLPVSIKDLFDVAGQVTSAGSRALADPPSAAARRRVPPPSRRSPPRRRPVSRRCRPSGRRAAR